MSDLYLKVVPCAIPTCYKSATISQVAKNDNYKTVQMTTIHHQNNSYRHETDIDLLHSNPSPIMAISDLRTKRSEAPTFKFITLTSQPSSQKHDFSYQVRSHAMQAFLCQKKLAINKDINSPISQIRAKTLSQSPSQLSGKFKLTTWSRKPRRKMCTKRIKEQEQKRAEKIETDDNDQTTCVETNKVVQKQQVSGHLPKCSEIYSIIQVSRLTFALFPYADALPIPLSHSSTRQLLHHFKCPTSPLMMITRIFSSPTSSQSATSSQCNVPSPSLTTTN